MLTIIIPTYNHGKYLRRAIAAVLIQKNYIEKVIVINDGSLDDTDQIMLAIEKNESKILYIKLNENKGIGNAHKLGLTYVKTEFFAFAAADDFLLPNWAEQTLKIMRANPEASICLTSSYFINQEKNKVWKNNFPVKQEGSFLNNKNFRKSLINYGIWFPSNTVVYRTNKYDAAFYIDEIGSFSDGILLILHGLKSGVCFLDQPLGSFVINENSLSTSVPSKNTALQMIPEIGKCLYEKHATLIDNELANRIFRKCIYIYFNESIEYIIKSYSLKIFVVNKNKILEKYFFIIIKIIKFSSFVLLKPEEIFKFKKYMYEVKAKNELNWIDKINRDLDNYWIN
jgi:glycosyltransferase involved in cell wall biosynthesis